MSAKIVYIENPIPSDSGQVGGEYTNQLTKLLKGGVISDTEEVFTIATPIHFLSGSILIADESSPTHRVAIEVDNIASGGMRHARLPTMDLDETQHFVMENEAQIITKKTLGTGTKFGVDINADGFNITDLKEIFVRDLGDRDVSFLDYNGANPNVYFDILFGYNTTNHAALSGATDIEFRIGYNSEIDSYEIWSRSSGSNEQLFKIFAGTVAGNDSKIDLNVDIIDFHNATINNISLSKSQIPGAVVYDDEANNFGDYLQRFSSTYFAWYDSNKTHSYIVNTSDLTTNVALILPPMSATDTFVFANLSQLLSEKAYDMLRIRNSAADPSANTTNSFLYRKDIDANNQALYINKLENGVAVKVRVT